MKKATQKKFITEFIQRFCPEFKLYNNSLNANPIVISYGEHTFVFTLDKNNNANLAIQITNIDLINEYIINIQDGNVLVKNQDNRYIYNSQFSDNISLRDIIRFMDECGLDNTLSNFKFVSFDIFKIPKTFSNYEKLINAYKKLPLFKQILSMLFGKNCVDDERIYYREGKISYTNNSVDVYLGYEEKRTFDLVISNSNFSVAFIFDTHGNLDQIKITYGKGKYLFFNYDQVCSGKTDKKAVGKTFIRKCKAIVKKILEINPEIKNIYGETDIGPKQILLEVFFSILNDPLRPSASRHSYAYTINEILRAFNPANDAQLYNNDDAQIIINDIHRFFLVNNALCNYQRIKLGSQIVISDSNNLCFKLSYEETNKVIMQLQFENRHITIEFDLNNKDVTNILSIDFGDGDIFRAQVNCETVQNILESFDFKNLLFTLLNQMGFNSNRSIDDFLSVIITMLPRDAYENIQPQIEKLFIPRQLRLLSVDEITEAIDSIANIITIGGLERTKYLHEVYLRELSIAQAKEENELNPIRKQRVIDILDTLGCFPNSEIKFASCGHEIDESGNFTINETAECFAQSHDDPNKRHVMNFTFVGERINIFEVISSLDENDRLLIADDYLYISNSNYSLTINFGSNWGFYLSNRVNPLGEVLIKKNTDVQMGTLEFLGKLNIISPTQEANNLTAEDLFAALLNSDYFISSIKCVLDKLFGNKRANMARNIIVEICPFLKPYLNSIHTSDSVSSILDEYGIITSAKELPTPCVLCKVDTNGICKTSNSISFISGDLILKARNTISNPNLRITIGSYSICFEASNGGYKLVDHYVDEPENDIYKMIIDKHKEQFSHIARGVIYSNNTVCSIIDEYLSSEAFVLLYKEATKELLEISGMPSGVIDPEELIDYINASLLLVTGQTYHPILTPLESNNNV